MTDARLSSAFPSHPKTRKLRRKLGSSGPLALIYLFLFARVSHPDGDLSGMTNEDIEIASDWDGDDGLFVHTLVSIGFLDGKEGEYRIHDWADHQPWSAGSIDRSLAGKWAALCKRYGREEAALRMPDYADRMRTAHEPDADRMPVASESSTEGMRTGCPASVSKALEQDQEPKPNSRKSFVRPSTSNAVHARGRS